MLHVIRQIPYATMRINLNIAGNSYIAQKTLISVRLLSIARTSAPNLSPGRGNTKMKSREFGSATIPTTFWHRHVGHIVRYGSPRKYWNLARAFARYLAGSQTIPTMPAFLKVEISRKCTVHCKYCFAKKEDVFFPLDEYKRLIDRFRRTLFQVSLYEIGEPLHNDRVCEYIRYAADRKIATVISSSLSLQRPAEFWNDLVASGLDRLIIAIDGVTPGVYNQYRTHGDFPLVMENARTILAERARQKAPLRVEWQMVNLPWNRLEQPAARKLAGEMGCDGFSVIPESNLSRRTCSRDCRRTKNCILPFLVLLVTAYGRVRTCFKTFDEHMEVGDLLSGSFEEIWNGPEMSKIRNKRTIGLRVPCRYCLE